MFKDFLYEDMVYTLFTRQMKTRIFRAYLQQGPNNIHYQLVVDLRERPTVRFELTARTAWSSLTLLSIVDESYSHYTASSRRDFPSNAGAKEVNRIWHAYMYHSQKGIII